MTIEDIEIYFDNVHDEYQSLNDVPNPTIARELSFKSIDLMCHYNNLQLNVNKANVRAGCTLTQERDYFYRKVKICELIHQHAKQLYNEMLTEINRKNV